MPRVPQRVSHFFAFPLSQNLLRILLDLIALDGKSSTTGQVLKKAVSVPEASRYRLTA